MEKAIKDYQMASRGNPLLKRQYLSKGAIYIVLAFYFIVAITPFTWSILNSFKTNDEIFARPFSFPSKIHWGNYVEAWTTGHLEIYFKNSIFIAMPVVIGSLAVSCLAGYAFGRIKFWGNIPVFYVFLFGLTIPFEAIVIPLYYTLMDLKLLDNLLGVIVPSIGGPFGIFLMRAFFRQLPGELSDSAKIDGCSEFGVFWRIMLPLAKPAVVSLVIFSFMGTWNEYFLPLVVLTSDSNRTLPLGIVHFQDRYFTDHRLVFAALVISFIPVIAVYITFQRQFVQGIAAGSYR